MIKLDIIHMFSNNISDINLSGIKFVKNNKTNNNEESKNSLITYIGETAIAISNEQKIKTKYNIKDEDIYMITFICSNIKELYNKLKSLNMNITKPAYSTRLNALCIHCKTKFQYMYLNPFKNSRFTICFREIDTSTDLINYQKAMVPNSASQDITGIKELKLHLNISSDELETLTKIFDNSYLDGNEFSSEIYTNQTLTITKDEKEFSEVLLEVRGKVFKGKEINLEGNIEKRNITFIY